MGIGVGDTAPDFTLPDQDGEPVTLSALRGKPVVLYFYPRDETPICTREACGFRDAYEQFAKAGAVVLGASGDAVASHGAFARRLGLPFRLLADVGDVVREAWGVPKTLGFLTGRTTYVLDREGVVRHVFSAALSAQAHVDEALKVVRSLA
jgi:thioredoxin-dependent peroxiredoxin